MGGGLSRLWSILWVPQGYSLIVFHCKNGGAILTVRYAQGTQGCWEMLKKSHGPPEKLSRNKSAELKLLQLPRHVLKKQNSQKEVTQTFCSGRYCLTAYPQYQLPQLLTYCSNTYGLGRTFQCCTNQSSPALDPLVRATGYINLPRSLVTDKYTEASSLTMLTS